MKCNKKYFYRGKMFFKKAPNLDLAFGLFNTNNKTTTGWFSGENVSFWAAELKFYCNTNLPSSYYS